MRYFLIILFMLAGLCAPAQAANEQTSDSKAPATQPLQPDPGGAADQGKQGSKQGEKKKPVAGEEEPDCE